MNAEDMMSCCGGFSVTTWSHLKVLLIKQMSTED